MSYEEWEKDKRKEINIKTCNNDEKKLKNKIVTISKI